MLCACLKAAISKVTVRAFRTYFSCRQTSALVTLPSQLSVVAKHARTDGNNQISFSPAENSDSFNSKGCIWREKLHLAAVLKFPPFSLSHQERRIAIKGWARCPGKAAAAQYGEENGKKNKQDFRDRARASARALCCWKCNCKWS